MAHDNVSNIFTVYVVISCKTVITLLWSEACLQAAYCLASKLNILVSIFEKSVLL